MIVYCDTSFLTSFDLWHVAAAWTLGAGAFLTFDKRRKEICATLSLRTG